MEIPVTGFIMHNKDSGSGAFSYPVSNKLEWHTGSCS